MGTRQTRSSSRQPLSGVPDIPVIEPKAKTAGTKVKDSKAKAEGQKAKAESSKAKAQKGQKAQKVQEAQKAIAALEDKSAADYADTRTPGAPSEKTKGKDVIRPITEEEDVNMFDSDVNTVDGSDVERTVRKKKSGAKEARVAIQAMRKLPQVELNCIEEEDPVTNDELDSGIKGMDSGEDLLVVHNVAAIESKAGGKRGITPGAQDLDIEMEDIQNEADVGSRVANQGQRVVSGSKRQHAEQKGTDSESSSEENPPPKKARVIDLKNLVRSSTSVSKKSKAVPKKTVKNLEGTTQAAETPAKAAATPPKPAKTKKVTTMKETAATPMKAAMTKKVTVTKEAAATTKTPVTKKAVTPKDVYELSSENEADVETEPETALDSTPVRKCAPKKLQRTYATAIDETTGEAIDMEDLVATPKVNGKATETGKQKARLPAPKGTQSGARLDGSHDKSVAKSRGNSNEVGNSRETKKSKKPAMVASTTEEDESRGETERVGGKKKAAPKMDKVDQSSDILAHGSKYKGKSKGKPQPKSNPVQTSSRSALNSTVKEVDSVNVTGGLSERDERYGKERQYAKASPLKRGQRLTSETLIKSEPVEEELEPAEKKKKTRACVKNAQLPSELLVRKKFSKIVLPTLFQWAAALKNPWRILPEHIKEAMKIIGRAHAGEDYDPSEDSPEVKSAIQRFCDTWRVQFQYNATWSLVAFFDSNRQTFGTSNKKRKMWAQQQLVKKKFIYRDASGQQKNDWKGPFENELILRTFTAHITAIKDSQWVGGLSYDGLDRLPRSALVLTTTTVERTLMLWAVGGFTIENVWIAQELKRKSITIVKQVSERGDETTGFSQFSSDNWSTPTRQFLVSVNALSGVEMQKIITASKPFVGRVSTGMVSDDSDDSDNSQCQLVRRLEDAREGEESENEMEVEEAEVVSGWGLIPKSIQDLSSSSDDEPIEIEDSPVPKKGKGKEVIRLCVSKKASSSVAGPSKKSHII